MTNTITKVTPQLVVAPTTAMKAVHLYEQIFGARLVRYNQFSKQASSGSSSSYRLFVCVEMELGSNTFVFGDCDDVQPPLPLAKVCIRIECSKGRIHRGAMVPAARKQHCTLEPEENMLRAACGVLLWGLSSNTLRGSISSTLMADSKVAGVIRPPLLICGSVLSGTPDTKLCQRQRWLYIITVSDDKRI